MVKIYLKFFLQKLLGFERYLFVFSLFSIRRFPRRTGDLEFYHFLQMIPKNANVLDIGSNIGVTAVLLAKRVTSGKVFCFEPIQIHVRVMGKILRRFKLENIEIFETALGSENKKLTMVMPEFRRVKFQGFTHVIEKAEDLRKGNLFIVDAQRLDDNKEIRKLPGVQAIKIDVENFEYQVLKGADNLLRQHKPLLYCELWEGQNRSRTFQYLIEELGYRVMIFDFEKNKLVEFENQPATNFFFLQDL